MFVNRNNMYFAIHGLVADFNRYSMKVMITERMRETLIGELGYLIEEVDDMEPQVSFL